MYNRAKFQLNFSGVCHNLIYKECVSCVLMNTIVIAAIIAISIGIPLIFIKAIPHGFVMICDDNFSLEPGVHLVNPMIECEQFKTSIELFYPFVQVNATSIFSVD